MFAAPPSRSAVVAYDYPIHVEPTTSVSVRSYTCPVVVAFRYQFFLLEATMDDVDDPILVGWSHLIIAWQAESALKDIRPYIGKSA